MVTFQVEKFSAFRDEAIPLFERHHREIAIDQDEIEYAPDWPQYDAMEKAGMLHCLTVRDAAEHGKGPGKIVGYFIALLWRHPHYSRAGLMALTDVYYLAPEFRKGGTGAKMLIALEHSLKAVGVIKGYLSCKIHDDNDHQQLFEHLGWRFTDKAFTKIFKR